MMAETVPGGRYLREDGALIDAEGRVIEAEPVKAAMPAAPAAPIEPIVPPDDPPPARPRRGKASE